MRLTKGEALAVIGAVCLASGTARAQSASTCSFDPVTATVTVAVNGETAHLRKVPGLGEIRLDGLPCGGATVFNTDAIQINGSAFEDQIIVSGRFVPGLTAETDGESEIEISFALGDRRDTAVINFGVGNDRIFFTSGGIDIAHDSDEDYIGLDTVDLIEVHAAGGDDIVDASAFSPTSGQLDLYGGDGNDRLTGSSWRNEIYGQAGDDVLYGGAQRDQLHGGSGNDRVYGGAGDDWIFAESTADGADLVSGGDGTDTAYYNQRAIAVTVRVGNGLADDGEASEGDEVLGNVEAVYGGAGDDLLIGSWGADALSGGGGHDEIYGGPGDDHLGGGAGDDSLFGEAGDDTLGGDGGDDVLTGGAGTDYMRAGGGDDLIDSADGVAEIVVCGPGEMDDAEADPVDHLYQCEL